MSNAAVTGVWRAQMDGLPALTMTITDESGTLAGAVLFYLIRHNDGQPARSSPGVPEPMLNVQREGEGIRFQVSHRRAHPPESSNDAPVTFHLKPTALNEGLLTRDGDTAQGMRVTPDQ